MTLLWYYGLTKCLHEEVGKAIARYEEKYVGVPTRIWFKTDTKVDVEAVHGLGIGYKGHVLRGHFEVSAEDVDDKDR